MYNSSGLLAGNKDHFEREEIGDAVLYCGDCFDVMATLPENAATVVITDPPYDEKTHKGARYGFRKTSSEIPFAPLAECERLTAEMLRLAQQWVVAFCSMEMLGSYKEAAGKAWVRSGFWRKPNGVPQFTGDRPGQPGEGVAIMHGPGKKVWNGGGKHGFWEVNIEQTDREHPTQKPLQLMRHLIVDFTQEGDVVFDPFMGSGTTGVAALENGRKFVGVELSSKYFTVAKQRIERAQQQQRLF